MIVLKGIKRKMIINYSGKREICIQKEGFIVTPVLSLMG